MSHRTHERYGLGSRLALVLAVAALVILLAIDLVTELDARTSTFHVIVEGCAIVAGLAAIAAIVQRMHRLSRAAHQLRELLATSRAEAERWARDARSLIEGLAGAIDQQLERWHLSAAEKEIALLLLKGLEHKQIAGLRGVSETTVRQQARSVYRKAELSGRHELAAFFLEDLLGPRARSNTDAAGSATPPAPLSGAARARAL